MNRGEGIHSEVRRIFKNENERGKEYGRTPGVGRDIEEMGIRS